MKWIRSHRVYVTFNIVSYDNDDDEEASFSIRLFLFLIRSISSINKQKSLANDEFITM